RGEELDPLLELAEMLGVRVDDREIVLADLLAEQTEAAHHAVEHALLVVADARQLRIGRAARREAGEQRLERSDGIGLARSLRARAGEERRPVLVPRDHEVERLERD